VAKNDKVILITGASSGIGAAAAIVFGKAGFRVALAARRKEKLDAVASGIDDSLVLQTDIGIEEQARKMVTDTVSHFGRIDVLVNNAALMIVTPSESVARDDLVNAFRTNFSVRLGTFLSNLPGFRIRIANQMAKTAREKLEKD